MDTNFNYSYDGITFSGVKRPGITMGGYPFGMKDNYEIDGENISKIKHLVFNAIDIDWNGAVLPNKGKTINTTSDLLNVIDKVEEVDVSGLAETFATKEELTQTEETISETISALNDTVDKKVDWVESVSGRNHIVLKNHDSILGTATDDSTYNLAMVSKWDVADFGSAQLHTNLNTSDAVTINDDKVIATTDQLDSMASGLLTTINSVAQAVSGKASTEYVDTKISDLIGAAPAELDTLKEIADRLATDNDALSGLFNEISTKASIDDVNAAKEESYNYKRELQENIYSLADNVYSKNEVYNKDEVYSKEEADSKFLTKIPEEYATLTYVDDKVKQIVGTAPENFDTLEELASVMNGLPKVVDQEAIEGVKYTQDEIDEAQEGDEAYGKTTDDWKVEPIEEQSHPMTISEFVTTSLESSLESVNEKPQIETLQTKYKTKYNALLSLLNITDADVNSVIVNKQLEGSNNVVYTDGYINNIETSASTTGIKTITANLGQENAEDLQMTTLTLGAPKSVTINNTGDHVVDLNVNAPVTGTSTPTVTIKDGDFDRIQLENASLTVQNDATVHAIEITPESKKNVTINCIFVEGKDMDGNPTAPTITNNSNYDVNITLNNKNEEATDIVVAAPNSTVTLSGGKWTTISGEVSENTLIIKASAQIQSLNLEKGNVIVEVPREEDIHNVITGEITLGDGYTITHRTYDITNDNSSKLGGVGEMILQEDITRTSSITAPLAPAYNAVWNLNGHNITVTGTPKYGVYLNRYTSNLEVKGNGTIQAKGAYGLWNAATTGKIIVNDGVTVEAQTHVLYAEKGEIIVNGGSFKLTNPEEAEKDANGNFKFLLNCYDANYLNGTASIKVKGGKFYGFNPAESYGEPLKDGKVANFVEKGYEVVALDDPTKEDYEYYEYGTVYEVRPISE